MENVATTINILESLGFIINREKSALVPVRSCCFLGFIVDTEYFTISIPADRRDNLLQSTLKMLSKTHCKIKILASFIGSLIAVCPAVQYGMLHTKLLEREKFLALASSGNNFEARMSLPVSLGKDLLWWKNIFTDKLQQNYIILDQDFLN